MALALYDRVRETTTVLGTSDATLLGAVTGFQSFAAVGNGNTCYYTIADNAGNWEVGLGTYSTTGPTLARTTVYSSSNSNNKVSFPAGTKDIFLTYPAEKAVYLDASGNTQPALGSVNATTVDTTNIEATNVKAKDGTASITLADSTGVATLTANPVLNAGTANGVAYLNGSKVVTSGSGFVYDGTNVGVGDSSPTYKLSVAGTGSDHQLWVRNTGTSASDDSIILIQTGGTGNTATISGLFFGDADSSSIGQLRYNHSNDSMTFYTGSTQRLGLVSSGNVQLNTAAAQILNSSGNPILASTGSVIQQVAYTVDAGSSTTSTTYVNLTASTKTFTPISTSSTLFIDVVFYGQISAGGAGVNSTGEFTLYEGGNVGSVYQLGVISASGTNVQTIAPCVIRYEVANTSTATRSFLLYGKKTGGTSRFYANDQRWTITEVAA